MLVCRCLQLGRGGPDTQGSLDGSQFGPMRSRRRRRMAPTRPKQVVSATGYRPDSIDPVVPMSTRGSRRRSPRWPTCRPCRSRTTLWLLWSVVARTADQKRSDNGVIFALRRGGDRRGCSRWPELLPALSYDPGGGEDNKIGRIEHTRNTPGSGSQYSQRGPSTV